MRRERNFSLLPHNTFGILTYCKSFIEYDNVEELCEILNELRTTTTLLPLLHIGSGSNLLFLEDYKGTILHSNIRGIEVQSETEDYVWVCVGAGVIWDDFVITAIQKGWYGIENLSLIPGEVGASAVQNIGAYGVEVEEVIDHVTAIAVNDGTKHILTHDECHYSYRNSIFKEEKRGQYIIVSVTYRLNKSFTPNYRYSALQQAVERRGLIGNVTANDIRSIVIDLRNSKLPLPEIQGNAGSFFMNPIISGHSFNFLRERFPHIISFPTSKGVKLSAGWLIEQAGWKGKRKGKAGVHSHQALVLVNLGGAEGKDILALCKAIQEDVEKKFGIHLVPEVIFVGKESTY